MQANLDVRPHRAASFTDSKTMSQEVKSVRSSSINLSSKLEQAVYSAPQSFVSISNNIFNDLSQAIQLVQKSFLEKEGKDKKMTNSDYQVHELCQQFDYVFLLGLRNRDEGYWKVVLEFTHKDVLKELKKLLNVNTGIGRGRAWIYHALNENLMESYLRCFSDNKKLVSKFYSPGVSLVSDEQSLSVLVTLVSGLENVEFKLFSDVPYLDHSCWPSHLKLKRQVIDQILSSPTHSLTQKMADLNKSLMEVSINLSQSPPKERTKSRPANNVSISEDNSEKIIVKPKVKIKKKHKKEVNMDTLSNDEISSSEQIDSEIDKLRKENSKMLEKKTNEKVISKSYVPNDLAARSLTASSQFDSKIEHIETYSKIIENATMNMDAFVKDMSDVYQNYEKFYQSNEVEPEMSTEVDNESKLLSVYDDSATKSIEFAESNDSSEKDKENRNVLFFSSSLSSLHTNNTNFDETRSNSKDEKDHFSVDSKIENENNYLDDTNCMDDLRQDIRVDNNTKLLLSLEILQNGSNEDIVKLYQCTRGHSQGEIDSIYILITTYGIYVLKNQQSNELQSEINVQNAINYKKELFMSHDQIDYIEVSLGDQSIHFVCFNKRSSLWVTSASRILTNNLLENLQTSRAQDKFLKFTKVPVFHEATQQKLALKKFLSSVESAQPQDIEINGYSLVFWEDQASANNHIIHKEGYLYYFIKTSGSNSSVEWKKAYFVLKNDVLTKYKTQGDKRPLRVIKLDGEDLSGCRKCNNMSRPHTIELIFARLHLYLSAKDEEEVSEWIQSFCNLISLGNYQSTDVPSLSCLPCCAVTTSKKLYFCHEDLVTGFYRLLESIKLEEINRVSFDNDNPFYCILHDDIDSTKTRYWFVYFVDRNERNEFINCFKKAWEEVFQVQLTIEKSKNVEMRKRCIKGVKMVQKSLENSMDLN